MKDRQRLTARPGIHHVIARTLKDSVCRYKTMQGFAVKRKAGWDTHGLPVEIEVEKQLNMTRQTGHRKIRHQRIQRKVQRIRIHIRKHVARDDQADGIPHRPGSSIHHAGQRLHRNSAGGSSRNSSRQALIYEGHKILPYCPRCGTGLASHEVAQGYKEVKVTTITANSRERTLTNISWHGRLRRGRWHPTYPLTVGPDIDYVKVKMTSGDEEGKVFYVAKVLADKVLGEGNYEVLEEMKGKDLEYVEYEQLMPFIEPDKKAFLRYMRRLCNHQKMVPVSYTRLLPSVKTTISTGRRYDLPVVNPVDEQGKYTETPWKGRFVMEDGLDVDIIKVAGSRKTRSTPRKKMEHNYPHCWRCGTPLVYYAKPSWYIEMTKLKDQLVANNNTVNWFPDFVGEKRFGNWLENVNDWAISRNRYWGTPIPIWRCECGHLECIGSRKLNWWKKHRRISRKISNFTDRMWMMYI